MKTFHEIAIQTDIYGVDGNEELTALFHKALDLCTETQAIEDTSTNPTSTTFREERHSPQFFTSDNVTYCVANVESVDLKPVPLVEFRISDNLDCVQGVFTQVNSKDNNQVNEVNKVVVQLDDNVRKVSGNKDSPIKLAEDGKEVAKTKKKCPVCSKEYLHKKSYDKHLTTHPELGHGDTETQPTEHETSLEQEDSQLDYESEDEMEQDSSGEEYNADDDDYDKDGDDDDDYGDDGNDDEDYDADHKPTTPKKKNSTQKSSTKKAPKIKQDVAKKTPIKRIKLSIKCGYCEVVFTNKKKYERHVRKHEKAQVSYICQYCNKDCKASSALRRHITTHTKEKPFECHLCEKAFATRQARQLHIRRHNNDRPYKCSYCNKGFVKKSAMDEHIRVHTGEKPFKCDVCDKSFRFKNVLKSHMTLHTGVRPYNCDLCGQGFVKTNHLEQHKRTHTGEKPFICSYCGKCFTSSTYWKQHEKKHLDSLTVDNLISNTETNIASNEFIG